jgi:hypothetical protein
MKIGLGILSLIICLCILIVCTVNFIMFGIDKIQFQHFNDIAQWGQTGDFIGGILNPLFGLLSTIGAFYTFYLTRKSLSENRLDARKDELARLILFFHDELEELLAQKFELYHIHFEEKGFDTYYFTEIFGRKKSKKLFGLFSSNHGEEQYWQDFHRNRNSFYEVISLFKALGDALSDYEQLNVNFERGLVKFMGKRFGHFAIDLIQSGFLQHHFWQQYEQKQHKGEKNLLAEV